MSSYLPHRRKAFQGVEYVQTIDDTGTVEVAAGATSNLIWTAHQFTSDIGGTGGQLDAVEFYCEQDGSPGAYTYNVEIWENSSNDPSSVVSGLSETFNLSAVPAEGAPAFLKVNFTTPQTLSDSTSYHIVFKSNQAADSFNHLAWFRLNSGSDDCNRSSDGSTWTEISFNSLIRAKLYWS